MQQPIKPTSLYSLVDTTLWSDDEVKALNREIEIDELVLDLLNYMKDVDYCDEVRNRHRDD